MIVADGTTVASGAEPSNWNACVGARQEASAGRGKAGFAGSIAGNEGADGDRRSPPPGVCRTSTRDL